MRISVKTNLLVLFLALGSMTAVSQSVPPRKTLELPGGQAPASPAGPVEATWESIQKHYHTPEWFMDAKFGIFIHWGLYSVPAAGSEWYPKHMYNAMADYHAKTWGSQDQFGYKDFIPLFKAEKFNADEWLDIIAEAGARYLIPTAEHHDGFAMYDSDLTQWDAKDMGPKRDIIGELKNAAQKRGIHFGVSNHRIENWDFMYPKKGIKHDLFDPQYADFYGPPQRPQDGNSAMGPSQEEIMDGIVKQAPQSKEFLEEWLARCEEIFDKYQPEIFYMDNGINSRSLDPYKLRLAQYYYNSARLWGKEVTLNTKSDAYLFGTVRDFERMSRAPKTMTDYYWQVDDPIGHKFGYVEGLRLQNARGIVNSLVNNISKNGNLCLNISPKGDGSIPEDQRQVLKAVGAWLKANGKAVYGTRAWTIFGEGRNIEGHNNKNNIRFTRSKDGKYLYAFVMGKHDRDITVHSLKKGVGSVKRVTMVADGTKKIYKQTADGLVISDIPSDKDDMPVVLRIELKL